MDAVKFLKTKNRICKMYSCIECPLRKVSTIDRGYQAECLAKKMLNEEEAIAIVEKWAEEHPPKTRQSEFLKMFPNVSIENGIIEILPCHLDSTYLERQKHLFACGSYADCKECKKAYWLAEVE